MWEKSNIEVVCVRSLEQEGRRDGEARGLRGDTTTKKTLLSSTKFRPIGSSYTSSMIASFANFVGSFLKNICFHFKNKY